MHEHVTARAANDTVLCQFTAVLLLTALTQEHLNSCSEFNPNEHTSCAHGGPSRWSLLPVSHFSATTGAAVDNTKGMFSSRDEGTDQERWHKNGCKYKQPKNE